MITPKLSSSSLLSDSTKQLLIYGTIGVILGVGVSKLIDLSKSGRAKIRKITVADQSLFESADYKKIVGEQLVRNVQFFGADAQNKISNSFIIVAGVGGVGSHVVSAIIRSGIKKIRLIDSDEISLSSLNKHAFAAYNDVGKSKVDCCATFIHKVFPHIEVEVFKGSLSEKNVQELLHGEPSYVIDCIGDAEGKAILIDHCLANKIKVIAACETDMKVDPTKIQIRDISDATYDGLARDLRMKLKARGRNKGVKVVFSLERPAKEHLVTERVKEHVVKAGKVAPKFGVMTALVAYSVASYVLCDIAGQMYTPRVMDDVKINTYESIYKTLAFKEKKKGVKDEELQVDFEDVYILIREIFEWTCLVTGKRFHNLELVRWDPKKKASIRNLVLMTEDAAKTHSGYTDIVGKYDNEITRAIDEKFHKLEEILRKRGPRYLN